MAIPDGPLTRPDALLIIAHPDDESMFFGPMLRSSREEYKWHVMCLSTGNADGLGQRRRVELQRACAILQVHVQGVVDDPMLQDGMQARWDHNRIQQHMVRAVDQLRPILVATFDELGVSGHPNHIAVHYAVKRWYATTATNCRLRFLRTVPTAVKFLGPLVMLMIAFVRLCGGLKGSSTLSGTTSIADTSDVTAIKEAMKAHESQYVWYRQLFIYFSMYTFVNIMRSEHKKDR